MPWITGNAVTVDTSGSLTGIINARKIMYANYLGRSSVTLSYFYMSEDAARTCVASRSFGSVTSVESSTSPAEAPSNCVDNGYDWFIGVLAGTAVTASNFDVVSWGQAIKR